MTTIFMPSAGFNEGYLVLCAWCEQEYRDSKRDDMAYKFVPRMQDPDKVDWKYDAPKMEQLEIALGLGGVSHGMCDLHYADFMSKTVHEKYKK